MAPGAPAACPLPWLSPEEIPIFTQFPTIQACNPPQSLPLLLSFPFSPSSFLNPKP